MKKIVAICENKECVDPYYDTRDLWFSSRKYEMLTQEEYDEVINKINKVLTYQMSSDEFYLKSEEEMASLFPAIPSAVENTAKIAEKCNLEFEFGKIKLPLFDIGEKDHFEYFKNKCYEGMYKIYGENPKSEVTERLDYELTTIENMGYERSSHVIILNFPQSPDLGKRSLVVLKILHGRAHILAMSHICILEHAGDILIDHPLEGLHLKLQPLPLWDTSAPRKGLNMKVYRHSSLCTRTRHWHTSSLALP